MMALTHDQPMQAAMLNSAVSLAASQPKRVARDHHLPQPCQGTERAEESHGQDADSIEENDGDYAVPETEPEDGNGQRTGGHRGQHEVDGEPQNSGLRRRLVGALVFCNPLDASLLDLEGRSLSLGSSALIEPLSRSGSDNQGAAEMTT